MNGFVVVALWILVLTGAGTALTWNAGRQAGLAPATRVATGWLTGQLALGAAAAGLSWVGVAWTPMRLLACVLFLTLPAAVWTWKRRQPPPAPPAACGSGRPPLMMASTSSGTTVVAPRSALPGI